MEQVKQTLYAKDVKALSETTKYSKVWDSCKVGLVKCITKQKFTENQQLRSKLLETKNMKLEEATFNKFWGTGIPVFGKEFKRGNYPGKNTMGKILEEIREELRPKEQCGEQVVVSPTPPTPRKEATPSVAASNKPIEIEEQVSGDQGIGVTVTTSNEIKEDATSDSNEMKEDALSTTSLYIAGMSESVLRCMLLGLKNANTGLEAQQQILTRLEELSNDASKATTPKDASKVIAPKATAEQNGNSK